MWDVACRTSPGGNSWNCHIHLMRCAARQFGGGASPESLTTNPFHIVHKLQEARRKVCSTTWNSYFTSWNAKVYYILLVLFLLSCAFASKHFAMTVYVRKLKFVEFMLFYYLEKKQYGLLSYYFLKFRIWNSSRLSILSKCSQSLVILNNLDG